MNLLIGVLIGVLIIFSILIYILIVKLATKIKILFGLKKYKFEKIPPYGDIPTIYKWFKGDDEAIHYGSNTNQDIITLILPKSEHRNVKLY